MEIGDTLRLTPTFDKECDVLDGGPRPCRVVYIHPLGRFHIVEFELRGGKVQESFQGVQD